MPDRVVSEEQCPDLLLDHVRCLRAQYAATASLMSFDLVQAGFEFPAFGVGGSEFSGTCLVGVHDGGDQAEDLSLAFTVRHFVFDDPDRKSGRSDPRCRWTARRRR